MNLKRQSPSMLAGIEGLHNWKTHKLTIPKISPRVKIAVDIAADISALMTIAALFVWAMAAL